ncbi:HutD family protein [Piscinibacter sp. XHJ-5]|uniref:HutD/Ves family protein n=1 Tax=Piscinibacter sp. XHJ-5 TaxID=3037797 RepID=UPI0024529F44|nr:HutD family protein [Piscinibacter sp. XHJ-5]
MSAQLVDVARIAPQPWKNGAGLTRELAVHPSGATPDDFDWRLSLAEVRHDAPFSAFPGIDRCIVLLRGAGMVLRSPSGIIERRLATPGDPFHFAGDDSVSARLIDGPSVDLNVMVRRGRYRTEVRTIVAETEFASAAAGLLLVLAGQWRGGGEAAVGEPMQALLWRHSMPAGRVVPLAAKSRALLVRLERTA